MGVCRVRQERRGKAVWLEEVIFFFKTKSRNYLNIILKHSFYGDCCPGRNERAQARLTTGVFLSLHWMYLSWLGTRPNKSIVSQADAPSSDVGRAGRDWGCLLPIVNRAGRARGHLALL